MIAWMPFGLAFILFFLTHSIPVRPGVKARIVGVIGVRGFTVFYSVLSTLMLIWLIVEAGNAPFVVVWEQANWQKYLTLTGMFVVCVLLALAIGQPNPFSFGGAQNHLFDPQSPGIIRFTRHPLLLGLTLWASLHLLSNGDLAHVILFGVFTCFAMLGRVIIDRRKRRELGAENWHTLLDQMAKARVFTAPQSWPRIAVGVFGFVVLILLHPVILGVSPFP